MLAETANFLGAGFGFLLSGLVVRSADDMPIALWITALISSFALVLYIFVGRTEPNKIIVKLDFKAGMAHILGDTRLILLLIFSGMAVGVSWTILALMEELLQPFHVSNVVIGVFGIIYVFAGFLSGCACTYWVRKVHKLGAPLRLTLLIAIVGILGI